MMGGTSVLLRKGAGLSLLFRRLELYRTESRMEQMLGRSSAPPGPVLHVCFPSVRASVLENLNRQREEGHLCDLSIQVQGHVFRAHRCVLAASSPYFHDQVLLKNVTTVSLPSVMDPLAFESVLASVYTGQLSIVRDDIVNYVTVASFLQMWHIVDKCTDILKRSRPLTQLSPAGATSSQQSPSSSDCCFTEEPERGEPAAEKREHLPPLATWRRPHHQGRWGRTTPLKVESPQPDHGCSVVPLTPNEAEFGPRHRFHLQRAQEEPRRRPERWMEADEGVGEISEEVKVKCEEEHQAGACHPSQTHAGPRWHQWQAGSCARSKPGSEEMRLDGGELETYDEIQEATGQVTQRPLPEFPEAPPWPQNASPTSSVPPSPPGTSCVGKLHFCHCGKAYALKSMRDRHVKMQHLNLRPFPCPVCSKSFKMKHHLTKHVKTHGSLRPFECAFCGKKVVWRDSFLKHQARCQRLVAVTTPSVAVEMSQDDGQVEEAPTANAESSAQ